VNTGAFFGGIFLIGLIDTLIPSAENPHDAPAEAEVEPLHKHPPGSDGTAPGPTTDASRPEVGSAEHRRLMRTGLFTALAIGIHNFPEGLATFLAALRDPGLGVAIAVAVALHNVPEGISVSVPIFYATGNRRKAFLYSFLSGLAEPIGAIVAYLAIRLVLGGEGGVIPPQVMGILFGGVAGVMVYISLDELLPTSRAYGKGHDSLIGLLGGMLVMALSLLLMK
jgi:ZIP family zinc transporter